ncbi:MAG: KH domain-containing protein [Coriobacteriales bacterium]|jgi:predicted RNA-binding protein YlqC (UPF0109 family)|nr:KH domain-containing protein [Coriobacteriales bacterium]
MSTIEHGSSEEQSKICSLVDMITRQLVDNPEQLEIRESVDEESCLIEISVAPDDVGKIIGRHGRIIKSIRALARAAATSSGLGQVDVEIVS